MIIPPENITVLPNQKVNLNCLAFSLGTLFYDWSKYNGTLPQTAIKSYINGKFFSLLGGRATVVYNLALLNVQTSDEGWYCCTATNEGGSIKECAWLEVNS